MYNNVALFLPNEGLTETLEIISTTVRRKTLAGENIGEFGELLANRQSFVSFGGQIIKI